MFLIVAGTCTDSYINNTWKKSNLVSYDSVWNIFCGFIFQGTIFNPSNNEKSFFFRSGDFKFWAVVNSYTIFDFGEEGQVNISAVMSCCFQRPDVAWFLSCDIRHSFAIHLKLAILFIRDLIWNAFFARRAINCFPIVKPRSNIHCLSWTNMLPCCTSVQCTIAHPIHMKIQQSWLSIPDILWGI